MGRDPLGEPKVRHLFVEKQFIALHISEVVQGQLGVELFEAAVFIFQVLETL